MTTYYIQGNNNLKNHWLLRNYRDQKTMKEEKKNIQNSRSRKHIFQEWKKDIFYLQLHYH